VIDDIQVSSFARVEMILLWPAGRSDRSPDRRPFAHRIESISDALAMTAWRMYVTLDRRRVRLTDDPLRDADASSRLRHVPRVELSRPTGHGADVASHDADAAIRAAALDVIIHLGSANEMDRDPRHELALVRSTSDLAAYGTWALRFGDPVVEGATPTYVQELVANAPVCTVSLERLPDSRTAGLTLATAAFPTDSGSPTRNRVQPLYGSTHLVIQKLRELHGFGWDRVARAAEPWPMPKAALRGGERLSLFRLARWIGPRLVRKAVQRLSITVTKRAPAWQWRTAIRTDAVGGPDRRLADMTGFRWLEAPPGHAYADPFVVRKDGRSWLFLEDLESPRAAGVISCREVEAGGIVGPPVVVLRSAGHVSYPYTFLEGETAYMIPETSAENAVRLYRAVRFPDEWEVVNELFRGPALDTSAWPHDGRWWFWTTLREPRSGALALMLFYADALDASWTSHPSNPISMDVRNARGAGSIFVENGRIYRPSQDCSRTYGYGFTLYEIVTLSTTEYEERPVVKVEPRWHPGLAGTHTYNRSDGIEVTDGKFSVTRSLRG
jgi:hypothetical protein